MIEAWDWDVAHLGTVAQWFSGLAGTGALLVTLRIFVRDRSYRQREQAELVSFTKTYEIKKTEYSASVVHLVGSNDSKRAIRWLMLEGHPRDVKKVIKVDPRLEADYAELLSERLRQPNNGAISYAFDGHDLAVQRDLNLEVQVDLIAKMWQKRDVASSVEAGKGFRMNLRLPMLPAAYDLWRSFADANGKRWMRNLETYEIKAAPHPKKKQLRPRSW